MNKDSGTEIPHPQYAQDRQAVDMLLAGQPTDYNLVELARLRIRYRGFPGAFDIQADLDRLLLLWQMDEDTLFARTRLIHERGNVYRVQAARSDWS